MRPYFLFMRRFWSGHFHLILIALFACLCGVGASAQPPVFPVTWSVRGQGTEYWYSGQVIFNELSVDAQGPSTSDCSQQRLSQQSAVAGLDWEATYTYTVSATRTICGSATVGVNGNGSVFSQSVGTNDVPSLVTNSGSFQAVSGQQYTAFALAQGGGSAAHLEVQIPDHVEFRTFSAVRSATGSVSVAVVVRPGETNFGRFFASPSAQFGMLSNVTYSLSWDNPNVDLVFSDTRTTNTANPLATVIGTTLIPFQNQFQSVPGRVHLERYDNGGEGFGYHDSDAVNRLGYRANEGVDVSYDLTTGAAVLGFTAAGEWLKYSINVRTGGVYGLVLSAARPALTSTAHIDIDGTNATGPILIPSTGGASNFQPVAVPNIFLAEGNHILRLVMDTGDAQYGSGNFSALDIIGSPDITAITRTNGVIGFTAATVPGQMYQLQFATDLTTRNWTALGAPVTATAITTRFSDSLASSGQRFYRVIKL